MIKVFTTQKDYSHYRNSLSHSSVGIVPTMGNLHEGHLSLLKKSVEENDVSVITIFVNPKQFGPNEDFDKYPRTLDQDLSKISSVAISMAPKKEIVVFAPASIEEIYPKGFNTIIRVAGVTEILEGARRPGHFDGVTTVVYRLFKIINAKKAYFGQKDFQQCVVIRKMIQDLSLDIDMKVMPIVRSASGLALSSRNQYLSETEKTHALHLSQTLRKIEAMIRNKEDYKMFIAEELKDTKWDYLEVKNSSDLSEPTAASKELVILGVYKMNETRLLDNLLVTNL